MLEPLALVKERKNKLNIFQLVFIEICFTN